MRTTLFLLFFSSICAVTAVYANMRQRWQVDRYPSYFPQSVPGTTVDSEDLNFMCDLAYEGDADWSEMQKRGCNVRALYAITTKIERGVALEFILPSEDPVTVFINGEKVKVDSREIVMTDTTRRAYRLSEVVISADQNPHVYTQRPLTGNCEQEEMKLKYNTDNPTVSTKRHTVTSRQVNGSIHLNTNYGLCAAGKCPPGSK